MTLYDKILIVAVIVLSALGIYSGKSQLDSNGAKYVYIEVDGEQYREITFDDSTEMSIDIDTEYGHNEVLIKGGEVNMVEADCNDQICVSERAISKTGDIVVCLPNRVLVEVRGAQESKGIDYMSN